MHGKQPLRLRLAQRELFRAARNVSRRITGLRAREAPVSLFVSHKAAAFVFLEAVCFCLLKLIRVPADQNTTPISNCKMRARENSPSEGLS